MKYVKLILIIILGFTLTFGNVSASIPRVDSIPGENMPISVFSALNRVIEWGQSVFNRIFHPQFGTISHVETTNTIGTLRTTVNTVIDSIQNTTSSLGLFASLASTTGNLIVGSSTQWRAMIVGANGSVLTASSTAVGGLSWSSTLTLPTSVDGSPMLNFDGFPTTGINYATADNSLTLNVGGAAIGKFRSAGVYSLGYGITNVADPIAGGIGLANTRITGAASGISYFNTGGNVGIGTTTPGTPLYVLGSTTISNALTLTNYGSAGCLSVTTGGLITTSTCSGAGISSLNGSTSSTQTFTAGNGIVISTANGAHTFYFSANVSTSTIQTATTTNLSVTSTLTFTADGTKQTTAYKSSGFTVINTTTTASSGIVAQRLFYQAFTLSQLDCSTNGATVTISAFVRASSTPTTNGTTTVANIACTSTGFSTTTFTNANFGANQYLSFASSSVANTTTTLNMSFKYKEQ